MDNDDPLSPAAGCIVGLVIGLATWGFVGMIYLAWRVLHP